MTKPTLFPVVWQCICIFKTFFFNTVGWISWVIITFTSKDLQKRKQISQLTGLMSQGQFSVLPQNWDKSLLDSNSQSVRLTNAHWVYKDSELQMSLKIWVFIPLCPSCSYQSGDSITSGCSGNKPSQGLIVLVWARTTVSVANLPQGSDVANIPSRCLRFPQPQRCGTHL